MLSPVALAIWKPNHYPPACWGGCVCGVFTVRVAACLALCSARRARLFVRLGRRTRFGFAVSVLGTQPKPLGFACLRALRAEPASP